MANRRMFAKSIINTGTFLKMSGSAQALYVKISLNSDDDGYCDKVFTMQLTFGKEKDLKELMENGFIYNFDNEVLLDLHWGKNNIIRKERKTDSQYIHLQPCHPDVTQTSPKSPHRLGKVRLGKVSIEKKQAKKETEIELPDWLDKKAWSEFLQHRKDIGKPLTPLSTKKALNVLERNKDHQQEIVDATICNRWTGLFDYKPNGKPPKESLADRQLKRLNEAYPDDK